jgi:hypothetical protein
MEKIYVKPAVAGAIVRHPEKINFILPPEGAEVVNSSQWQRYLRDGDVVLASPPAVSANEPKVNESKKGGAK